MASRDFGVGPKNGSLSTKVSPKKTSLYIYKHWDFDIIATQVSSNQKQMTCVIWCQELPNYHPFFHLTDYPDRNSVFGRLSLPTDPQQHLQFSKGFINFDYSLLSIVPLLISQF